VVLVEAVELVRFHGFAADLLLVGIDRREDRVATRWGLKRLVDSMVRGSGHGRYLWRHGETCSPRVSMI
jgi:hypothetical protein